MRARVTWNGAVFGGLPEDRPFFRTAIVLRIIYIMLGYLNQDVGYYVVSWSLDTLLHAQPRSWTHGPARLTEPHEADYLDPFSRRRYCQGSTA